jgi:type I restriction-modification system DNA methylase subunit
MRMLANSRCYELLKSLIDDFSPDNLQYFLSYKIPGMDIYENRLYLSDFGFSEERFEDVFLELGEAKLDGDLVKAYAIKLNRELSEKTSKKSQFDCAKKILNSDRSIPDAGFFAFYDDKGNFRLSFVHKIYRAPKTEFSHYKRLTYFVEKGKPYRTFLRQLSETPFDSLKDIITAFSIQPLTKEFYTEIQNWFAWALKKAWFPGGTVEENLIRLLTRLIFVWFLKERKLVPEELFDECFLADVVKDFGKKDYYYNVILQNLFFATLNRYPHERGWALDEGFPANRNNFGLKNLFRREDFLKIPTKEFMEIFKDIPFINGGLFECLDKDKDYVDGFSRKDNKRAKLPDYLFFSPEREVDLSHFYGERKIAKVRGLINILKDYNFTADENSPVDVEVSLDPELLGHIFENLLAAYNPETQTTARKATGSYYTPKEIVEFMVDESLLEYFKGTTKISEEKLRDLLSYEEREVELSDEETNDLMKAIDRLKVIDPAVGSGAFPMGVLHKLVHIMNKIDPQNDLWYELQYEKALRETEAVFKILDKKERERLLKEINDNFDESYNYPDYARKLYLIENSLYGVDILPIAIQICKLRFFLSLLIDQKIDRSRENFGIRPLPHLETKFVAANTLIGLGEQAQPRLQDPELDKLKDELRQLYKRHFSIKNREEKKRIDEKSEIVKERMKEVLARGGWPNETIEKIVSYDIFDQTAKADWFDPVWMFGVEDGFDIVIANPPYVRQERIKEYKPILQAQGYEVFDPRADLYVYFYEKGYNLLRDGGIFCFISSNKWMRARYGTKLRNFLKRKTTILKIVDFDGYPVFEQTVDTNIILFKKEPPKRKHQLLFVNMENKSGDISDVIEEIKEKFQPLLQERLSDNAWTLADEKVLALKEKIERMGKPLKDWDVGIYYGIKTGFNEAFIIDMQKREEILANCRTEEERRRTEGIIKPVLRGRDIFRYGYKWAGLWIILAKFGFHKVARFYPAVIEHLAKYEKELKQRGQCRYNRAGQRINNKGYPGQHHWLELDNNPSDEYLSEFEKEKIVWAETADRIKMAIVPPGIYLLKTCFVLTGKKLKYILAVSNSKLMDWFVRQCVYRLGEEGVYASGYFMEILPIPPITPQNQEIAKQLERLVDEILSFTQSEDYLENPEKQRQVQELEQKIDELVYKLYGLNEEEIRIVEERFRGN